MRLYESAWAVAINDHPLSLASARTQSHDTVIANAGSDRRSGVSWTTYPVRTAQAQLAGVVALPPDVLAVMASYPDGVLVMATVEVEE